MSWLFLARLVPTYGNWGGPYWSGGTRNGPDWGVAPVDSLDHVFYDHDVRYHAAGGDRFKELEADRLLREELGELRWDPLAWDRPPESASYAAAYRLGAAIAFDWKRKVARFLS